MQTSNFSVLVYFLQSVCDQKSNLVLFLSAFRLAQIAQHGSVDALRPDVQEPALPVGPAGRALGQLQGREKSGHRPEEALPSGGKLLQAVQ